ncbi:hypothetical protein SCLCIDRAFT_117083 [Scleroderma citrinum Foug A]|uniref:Uncharacterized protein n=1 Tax=Scleroderma citrinum Foug A TaxID=1036808 RepID=A0A0C3AEU4_9AGAM|nr:hypothetical protein SCLCIDRAFT_117083 [Scleroderma citrinum Foug A]
MWTADWWWDMQQQLPPVILASNKTQLTHLQGDKFAWPVYLMIGNISKDLHVQVSLHTTILLGYIPVGKFNNFSEKTQPIAQYQLFHHCMALILASLVNMGQSGIKMMCTDSTICWIFPILTAYLANYPEQCLIACCMENRCPLCKIDPNAGVNICGPKCDMPELLDLLVCHESQSSTVLRQEMKIIGLCPVYPPFWKDLPHTDIFQAFTPDLLHQLHKGVFKEHLVKWSMAIISDEEINARFKCMTLHPRLWQFKNGISSVSQWTGKEHKEMQKAFMGLVAGGTEPCFVQAVQAVTNFIFYSSLRSHTLHTV